MCIRSKKASAITTFDNLSDAFTAAGRQPCGPLCAGDHVVAWQENGVIAAEFVGPDRRVSSLPVQLDRLYRRTPTKVPVECYPHPSVLNPPQPQKTRPR
jgi:hypothetical protein